MTKLFGDVKKWYLEYHDWPIPAKDKLRKITDGYVKGPVKIEEWEPAEVEACFYWYADGSVAYGRTWESTRDFLLHDKKYRINHDLSHVLKDKNITHIMPIPEIGEK